MPDIVGIAVGDVVGAPIAVGVAVGVTTGGIDVSEQRENDPDPHTSNENGKLGDISTRDKRDPPETPADDVTSY
jgi:hypothetical protein